MKKLLLVLAAFLLVGCSSQSSQSGNNPDSNVGSGVTEERFVVNDRGNAVGVEVIQVDGYPLNCVVWIASNGSGGITCDWDGWRAVKDL